MPIVVAKLLQPMGLWNFPLLAEIGPEAEMAAQGVTREARNGDSPDDIYGLPALCRLARLTVYAADTNAEVLDDIPDGLVRRLIVGSSGEDARLEVTVSGTGVVVGEEIIGGDQISYWTAQGSGDSVQDMRVQEVSHLILHSDMVEVLRLHDPANGGAQAA